MEFRQADMTALGYPDGTFDAVICVFGIFFVKDMEALTTELWRMVKPGGRLAITTWGPRLFAPMYEKWNETVCDLRSDLVADFNPWDRITTTEAVHRLFADAGIPDVEVTPEAGSQQLDGPDDVWTVAAGSGLRWVIEQLGSDAEQLRKAMLAWARETRLAAIETNVIILSRRDRSSDDRKVAPIFPPQSEHNLRGCLPGSALVVVRDVWRLSRLHVRPSAKELLYARKGG